MISTGHRAGKPYRYQIKTRCILPGAKPGQRIGRIDLSEMVWSRDAPR